MQEPRLDPMMNPRSTRRTDNPSEEGYMLVAVIFRSDIDVPKFDHRAPARIALPTSTRFRSTAPDHGRV